MKNLLLITFITLGLSSINAQVAFNEIKDNLVASKKIEKATIVVKEKKSESKKKYFSLKRIVKVTREEKEEATLAAIAKG